MPDFVLDTSALITVFRREPGVDRVLEILEATAVAADEPKDGEPAPAARVYLPFMALMELEYLSRQRLGEEETRRVCDLAKGRLT